MSTGPGTRARHSCCFGVTASRRVPCIAGSPLSVPITARDPMIDRKWRRSNHARRSRGRLCASGAWLAAGALLLAPTAALAAGPQPQPSEPLFLAQILLLLIVGRLFGEAMQRLGQPAVMGQLLAGIVLGPSVLGAALPQLQHALFPMGHGQASMLEAVSQLGILMLLLLTGMETDVALVSRLRRAAFSISVTGIGVPFLCGFALGEFLPESTLPRPELRLITALFLGTALAISSVKIVAVVVREMDFMRRTVGQLIVASAIIDDTIGWILVAVISGLALHGRVDLGALGFSVLGTLLFLAASYWVGRRWVAAVIRWSNDNFVSELPVITVILVIMGALALITYGIGVQMVLGAFVAGLLVGQSPILTDHIREQLRGLIVALFMPVFFGLAGLTADLRILGNPALLLVTAGLVLIASLGKFGGAFLGGTLAKLGHRESLALACGMNARGSTEVIIATIGLAMGALNQALFTMAVTTTMVMPPMLRWALRRLPLGREERERLEREAFEARGFVANLERLLIAGDDSGNGRFASRLAGRRAGAQRMPTTILELTPGDPLPAALRPADGGAEAVLRDAAEQAPPDAGAGKEREAADVTTRRNKAPGREAVAREARKGYDLLMIGIAQTAARDGGFDLEIARLAGSFDGPLGIVEARGPHREDPVGAGLDILVPFTGSQVSRRAFEIAVAIARSAQAPVTALYVSATATQDARRRPPGIRFRRDEDAVLREAVEIAERFQVTIRTVVRRRVPVGDAIERQASRGRHNLIVLGVSPSGGDTLFFGNTAMDLLERAACSLLFVSS